MSLHSTSSALLWRVVLGFLFAPYAGFWAYILMGGLAEGHFPFVFFPFDPLMLVAYAPALVLGVPAYLLLKDVARASALNCAATGAMVAAAAGVLLMAIAETRLGWGLMSALALLAGCGAVGGLVFWIVVTATPRECSRISSLD